jgi:hypothetical protein
MLRAHAWTETGHGEDDMCCLRHLCVCLQDAFPDRGQSPERLQAVAEGKRQGKNLTAAPKTAGYVPPHLRGPNGERMKDQVEGFDADEVPSCYTHVSSRLVV